MVTSPGDEEQEIVVTGEQEGYSVPDASTATRTDTPLRDIPQSTQVVPRQVIEDRQITRISDAVRNVSGVTVQREYGDYSDAYNIRGFTTYDTLRNGFQGFSTIVPSNNIERVEVLKGPASILYGQFEPGGVVHYITKQPLSEPYYAAEFTAGSYDYYSPSIDFSGSLTGDRKLLYRLNTAYTSSDSFVDFVERDVFSISPTLTYRFSDATTLALSYDYIQSDGVHYDGFAPDPRFFQAPINRFTGEPDGNDDETERHEINLTFLHRFNDNLEFRSNFAVSIDRSNNSIFRPRGLEDDGRTVIRSYERNLFNDNDIYTLQNNLIAKFNTGAIAPQLLLGFDWSEDTQENVNLFLDDGEVASLDLFDPIYGTPIPTQLNGTDAEFESRIETHAIYLQDQLTLLPNLKLLVGGRYDFVDNRTITQSYRGENILSTDDITDESFYDEAFSPRIGIVYQPIEPISLYASYSRSFAPNNARTASGTPIEQMHPFSTAMTTGG
ncbi:TonB-dependent siderophore receptor [Scytonema millei]|uniref:TonB-dependent receptor n=1 Tax=Scytonema millei VB511283 TaxID=1245923 RepID=A0A9X5E9R1_9CYAN|nr:TonB-dependent receptor [Scytonema millei]NHC37930.1 TonB-dependent receptor [Scytonema millei VB511283]